MTDDSEKPKLRVQPIVPTAKKVITRKPPRAIAAEPDPSQVEKTRIIPKAAAATPIDILLQEVHPYVQSATTLLEEAMDSYDRHSLIATFVKCSNTLNVKPSNSQAKPVKNGDLLKQFIATAQQQYDPAVEELFATARRHFQATSKDPAIRALGAIKQEMRYLETLNNALTVWPSKLQSPTRDTWVSVPKSEYTPGHPDFHIDTRGEKPAYKMRINEEDPILQRVPKHMKRLAAALEEFNKLDISMIPKELFGVQAATRESFAQIEKVLPYLELDTDKKSTPGKGPEAYLYMLQRYYPKMAMYALRVSLTQDSPREKH